MKVAVLYLRVMRRADPSLPMPFPYEVGHARFLDTYKKFTPKCPHDLIIVNCGITKDVSPFDDLANKYCYYDGIGSDCGTYQSVVSTLDYDLVLCLNSITYFWRPGWLEPFIEAASKLGPGVYGASGSYENNPHLRTPAIACSPSVIAKYPVFVNSRQEAIEFESGTRNFSLWAECSGYPSVMVASDGIYRREDWRMPANIFRRGDQSNVLIWDRHTDLYMNADSATKQSLEAAANG
jgi:hypothetical protein